jgi:hypothetical protein
LQISKLLGTGQEVIINLLPDFDLADAIKQWQKETAERGDQKSDRRAVDPGASHQTMAGSVPSAGNKPVSQYRVKKE